MQSHHRVWKILLSLIVLACLGSYLAWRWLQPREVIVAEVSRGPMAVLIEEDGKTRLKDRYIVSSPLLGRVLRIGLKPGDAVEASKTVLATLQPTAPGLLDARQRAQAEARKSAAALSVEQAQSNLNRVRESLSLAEKTLGRIIELKTESSASEQELDNAQAEYRSQKASYAVAAIAKDIAEFELEQAKAALLQFESDQGEQGSYEFAIASPISGRVLRVFLESTAVVQPGTPLLEVGDPRNIEIETDVLSSDAVKIAEGNDVTILRWGGEHALHGKVRRVEPGAFTKVSALGVEEQRVNVLIDLLEPPEQRPTLGDAFRVETQIRYWESKEVLRVPSSALFRNEGRWAVFTVSRGLVRRQFLEIGHRNSEYAEVLSGLEERSMIVRNPTDEVHDGMRVKVVTQ